MSDTASPSPGRLAGHRALVTGGASGIGAAIAARLAADGAAVVIGDIDDAAAKAQAEQCGAAAGGAYLPRHQPAGRAVAVHLDVSDPESARAAVADTGPFDILVNNAGIDHPGVFFTDVTPEQWRRLLAVNLEGVFACGEPRAVSCSDWLGPLVSAVVCDPTELARGLLASNAIAAAPEVIAEARPRPPR